MSRSLQEDLQEARRRCDEFSNVCFRPSVTEDGEVRRRVEKDREAEWNFDKIREVVVMYMDYLVAPVIQQNAREVKRTVDELSGRVAMLQRKVESLQMKVNSKPVSQPLSQPASVPPPQVMSATNTVKSTTTDIPILKLDSMSGSLNGSQSLRLSRSGIFTGMVTPPLPEAAVPIITVDEEGTDRETPLHDETTSTTTFEGSDTTSPAEINRNIHTILKTVTRRSSSPPPYIPDVHSQVSIDRVDSAFGPLTNTTTAGTMAHVRFASPLAHNPFAETFTSMNNNLLSPESTSSEVTVYEDDPTEI